MIDNIHIPVMYDEVISLLAPKTGESYLDLTAGYGGHAEKILSLSGKEGVATLVDRDINAINYLKIKFAEDNRVEFINSDFENASRDIASKKQSYDCILVDLGVSSPHLDNPDRGFSFMNDGPLDMRMDNSRGKTAAEIVNEYSEQELADLLYKYGELHNSRRLASLIIANRPFKSTNDLASVIPGQFKLRMRTLAQVFQALRIEVNDELGQLERSLPIWIKLLKPKGRLAVITFHSLEDRIVKQFFADYKKGDMISDFEIINKKALTAGKDELVYNPRARSAKLRALQRK